jgi:Immunoglobulin I-set domain
VPRKPIVLVMAIASVLAALALTAASASAAQRIDMKVLLLGTSTTEPDFVSWQAALQREGVPFEAIVTSPGHAPITAATLSDTLAGGTQEAKYQAVIVAVGDLPECGESGCVSTLSSSEWLALEEYEHTFNVRQLTGDVFPSSTYGLNSPTSSGALDGTQGTLTSEGKTVFPYLNGPVGMATGTYGYEATPLATQASGASFQTLVSGPGGSALVGLYTRPDGVQEMVETFNQNQSQLQAELLRHGALDWVTRGVYFGDQRNYVEMDIDDTFTPDDSWDTTTHTIDYDDADALRMAPADVDYAAKWSEEHHFRMEQLFNGGGSVEYQAEHGALDPLLAEFQKTDPATGKPYADSFGWLSHTYDTPYLDVGCATQNYIEAELNENTNWAAAAPGQAAGTGGLGLSETTEASVPLGAENPHVFVPGNHSGFADLVPGNPATVDEPDLNPSSVKSAGGSMAAGSYQYAVSDQFEESSSAGQSAAYVTEPLSVPAGGSVTLEWQAICHAADYLIYRESAGSGDWSLIGTVKTPFSATLPDSSVGEAASSSDVSGGGEKQLTFSDTGAAGTAESAGWTPPSGEDAVESPWEQNPYFIPALEAVGITDVGADASKGYPDPPEDAFGIGAPYTGLEYQPGETFLDGTAQVVPRHPINIYYNASTEAQEVDEYNTLYEPSSLGGQCVASSTTTCETAPVSFAEIVQSVVSGMFQNMMANDPRPSYVHQTNLMGQPPATEPTNSTPLPATPETTGDGLLYSVLDPLLGEYEEYFNSSAPYEQLTLGAIGNLLAEQAAWKAALAAGQLSGYIEGDEVTIQNSGAGALNVPLTGVSGVGSLYGGIQSGWTSVPGGTSTHSAPVAWPEDPAPSEAPKVTTNPLAETVTAGEGATFTAAASGVPAPTVQWQVSTNGGSTFANDTTDSGNTTATLTVASTTAALSGREYRAVFTNSTGSATSTAATLTVNPKPEAPKVTTNPLAKTVTAGEGATFTAEASGVPAPTVQWQVSTNGGSTFEAVPGATSDTLTIPSTSTTESGNKYEAVFTNSQGSATSEPATLTVNPKPEAPKVTTNPLSKTVTAGEGATFTAEASGVPAPTVQWEVSTNGGSSFEAVPGATSDTLTIPSTSTTESGNKYEAVFTNSQGSATSEPATLTVEAATTGTPIAGSVSPVFGETSTPVPITGADGTQIKQSKNTSVSGCPLRIVGHKVVGNTVLLIVQTFAAGRISGGGPNLATVYWHLGDATKAVTLRVPLTRRARGKHRPLRVRVRVGFVPTQKGACWTAFVTVTFH